MAPRKPRDTDSDCDVLGSSDSDVAITKASLPKAAIILLKGQTPGTVISLCTLALVAFGFYSGIPLIGGTLKEQAAAFHAAIEKQEGAFRRAIDDERAERRAERQQFKSEMEKRDQLNATRDELFRQALKAQQEAFRDALKDIWQHLEALHQ